MIVELKKTKITKSIVLQSLRGSNSLYIEHSNYDVLGWCLITGKNDMRFILLYNKLKNTVVRLPYSMGSQLSTKSESKQTINDKGWYDYPMFHNLHLYLLDYKQYTPLFENTEESETEAAKKKVSEFLTEVQEKGQIYL